MGSNRQEIVTKVLQSVIELPVEEREAFLAETCAEDPALRSEVEALLLARHKAENGAEARPDPEVVTATEEKCRPATLVGRHIGPYRIERQIGQGGMGTVYLAARDDKEFQKRVVVKLVKRGMDNQDLIRRFRVERQILASLDHPHIAKLLDGGTTEDGLPYFVMDYVDGTPIDKYCDEHKLNTVERLKLFLTVCSAVHAAHQNLIVHRDIKPTNILVTLNGQPRLLDFGIAKLLDTGLFPSENITTAPDERPMTPAFASPEQIRGEPVTTASDVYSLGILLYQLLTGHRPYHFKSQQRQEVERVVCEVEPEKPSEIISRTEEEIAGGTSVTLTPVSVSKTREGEPARLRRRLAGDLDNIVLMAIRKEPERRYASVHQLSEDIQRYLNGRPVIARKDTFLYRSSKFIRRHKKGAVATLLMLVTLVAGIIGTAWESHVARLQKERAERRFNDVRKLANSFMFEIHDAIENLPGATRARELLVGRALQYLDSLVQEADTDLSLKDELATAYQKVGDVQGNPFSANRGDKAEALKSYQKSMALRMEIIRVRPEDPGARRNLAEGYGRLAEMLRTSGNLAGALESARKELAVWEEATKGGTWDLKDQRSLAASYDTVGELLAETGDTSGGLELVRKALNLRKVLAKQDDSPETLRDLSVSYGKLGNLLWMSNQAPSAMDYYGQAASLRVQLVAQDPRNARLQRELSLAYAAIGDSLWAANEIAAALRNYNKALTIREELQAADPNNAQARRDLAIIHGNLGTTLIYTRDTAGAFQHMQKALSLFQELALREPKSIQAQRDLSLCYTNTGDMHLENNDRTAALEDYYQGLASLQPIAEADRANAVIQYRLANLLFRMGGVFVSLASDPKTPAGQRGQQWREARATYEKSLAVWQGMAQRGQLKESQQQKIKEASAAIAKCEAALSNKNSH
jgi:serine/threonine protein kinase/tetratricopeptide (TPR) repeat protein